MAYAAYGAAITRVRELLTGGYGTLRPITSTRLQGDLPDGLGADEDARRGIQTEIPIEVAFGGRRAHPQRLVITGNVQFSLIDFVVSVVRTIAIDGQVDDTVRDDIRAQAMVDADAIEQVLEWPANLTQTQAGTQTGLMAIKYTQTLAATVEGEAGKAQVLRTRHLLTGTIQSAPAVS